MRLIVLAAGQSSRMGMAKGLCQVGGKTLIESLGASFAAAQGRDLVVVLGKDAASYLDAYPVWASGRPFDWMGLRTLVIINEATERGPFYSLQCGIRALKRPAWSFVTPVDSFCQGAAFWRQLWERRSAGVLAICPRHANRGGHPVLLAPEMLMALREASWTGDSARLDLQLRALEPSQRLWVEVDEPGLILNLNTPDDLATLRSNTSELV